jgi:hypothetical protein
MKRPSPKARPASTRGTSEDKVATLTRERNPRDAQCPWPCLLDGRIVRLVDRAGCQRASWCHVCDQALTQSDWDALLETRHS